MKRYTIGLIFCFFISGCRVTVNYFPKSSNLYTPKSSSHPITVFQMNEVLPNIYIVIGSINVHDTMLMTLKCGYNDVIMAAQNQARDVGGDAIQIIQMIPDITGDCFNLIVNVLVVNTE